MSTHRITSVGRRSPPASKRANALLSGPLTERDRRQPRQPPLGRHVQKSFDRRGDAWHPGNRVGGRRRHRSDPQPAVDHAERVRLNGTPPAVVVVREELGAIRGDVDVGRALGLARLARQAQVERLLDVLVLPAVPHDFALQQLEQHVRAAARAVLLFERHHVARAHRSRVVLPALAQADAAQRRSFQRAAIVGKREVRDRPARRVVGPETQVFSWQIRVDQLARIQLAVRIPNRLELAEGGHQLVAEHLRKQRAARLAVAVLPGERPAVAARPGRPRDRRTRRTCGCHPRSPDRS